ncbi:RHS repeat-associated protein [Saccharothrix saharensis]|uniref:RHS repeat-associated protein n=1 Tax=Saccharothrix saharensis TaxID=571190 RepID=A0A543JBH5_9PSEU|nr:RHS repeat-associated protein [Saccharothrix saharensis]
MLAVVAPVVPGSQTPFGPGRGLPPGASTTAPEQRGGTADDSTHDASAQDSRFGRELPPRDQARPAGAVPDQAAPLPEVRAFTAGQQRVTPAVTGARDVPAIDANAVERTGDRTEDSQTFDNPDGTRTLRLHTGQANVRQADGSWQPVDLTLAPDGDRVRPGTTPVEVSFATSAQARDLVRVEFDADHHLTYGLRDAAASRGEVSGSAITYRAVLPATDLRLTATRTGLKEDLVLASAAAPTSYSFTLSTRALQPRLGAAGDVELVDGDEVVAVIPAGFMDDAAGVRSTGVRYALDRSGDAWTLRVDLDQAWLRAPERVFPVTVDPSAGRFTTDLDDTYVRSNQASRPSAIDLEVGRVQGQPASRAYLRFGAAQNSLRNTFVLSASLAVDNIYSPNCTPRSVTVFEVTQPWNGTTPWPGAAVGQALSSKSFAHGGPAGSACAAPGWEGLPLDAWLMTRWTHGAALAHGLSLRASDETDVNGKRFASANSANPPYLDVRYSPEGASFEVSGVTLPTNSRAGSLQATAVNLGSSTWTPGGGTRFGYIVKQGDTFIRTPTFAPPHDVPPMGSAAFDVPIDPLAPGDYQLYLTMFTPGGHDYFVAHGVPYGRVDLTVHNTPPSSNYQQPGSGSVVESVTPTLFAEGVDDDNWPARGLTYKFLVCTDEALTAGCQESGWTAQSWTPEPLKWAETYFWAVKVYDTVDATPFWIGPLVLTTRVPQPQITSHLAGNPDGALAPGLDPNIGNYSTTVTDAAVATAGPDLTITRTYNSLDPRRDTAFGVGWASRLDMRLEQDDDRSGNVVVTYPSGRQIRFGRNSDGTFGSPLGDSAELVHDTASGYYTLRDSTGGQWRFDVLGRLRAIVDPAGLVEDLHYDANDHVTRIASAVSGRELTMTWVGGHVTAVTTQPPATGAAPLVWTYEYVGDRLTKACVPGVGPNCTTYGHTAASHYPSSVLDDKPRTYWRLGETEGDTFANATARRPGEHAATPHGVILGTGGALGGTGDAAASFDGNSSYVTLPDDLTKGTMSLAVELWFKTTAHGTLISYADQPFPSGTPTRSTPILYVGTDGLLYGGFSLRDTGGPRQVVSTRPVADGQWHHAVLSAAIDTQVLYLDGRAEGTLSGLVDPKQQGKLTLGAGVAKDWPATNGANFHFDGSIDEVALYGRPLGALAARQHFDARASIDVLTSITLPQDDRQFARITYDDVNDRVKTLVDHHGRTWSTDTPVVLDATRTAVLRGPANHGDWTHTFDVDNGGRQTGRLHRGVWRKYEYNTAGFRSAVVDESDRRTEETTDERGNVLSRKTCRAPGSCNTTYFTYVRSTDPLDPRRDKVESTSDARSSGPEDTTYRMTFAYDEDGRPTRTTRPKPEGAATAPVETHTYSTGVEPSADGRTVPAGLLLTSTGARNQVTSYSYFANGDLAQVTGPTGLRVRHTYDALGRRTAITRANAGGVAFGTTTYEYTPRSQLAKTTEPTTTNPVTGAKHAKVTSYEYDGNGNLVKTVVADALPVDQGGAAARSTTMAYDAHDRLVSTRFPDGGEETRAYLDHGLTQVVTDVNGTAWASQFDERGLLLSRTTTGAGVDPEDPAATGLLVESHVYDPSGLRQTSYDAAGRRTEYRYYDDGLPASVVRKDHSRPDGSVVDVTLEERFYDPAGNLTQVVGAGGRKTVQAFDAAGFVTTATVDPEGLQRSTTYRRDADGNPVRVESRGAADPNRVEVAAYEYDAAGLVTREDAVLDATTTFSTHYDRDERGLVLAATDRRQITTSYDYDPNGLPVTTTHPPTEVWVAGVRTTGFARTEVVGRNAFGEPTHVKDGNGGVTTYDRDLMGRATTTTVPEYTPPGGTPVRAAARSEYDHAGRLTRMTDPLDRVTSYEYDPYGRVLAVTLPQVGTAPSVERTTYDRVGQVLSRTDPAGGQTRFTYDDLGRQVTSTQVDRSSGTALYYTTTVRYDPAGNPVAVTNPLQSTETAAFDAIGAVLSRTDATNRTVGYGYDNAGRLATATDTAGVVTVHTYDLLGRKTRSAQLVDGVERRATGFRYDAADNLVEETTPQGRVRGFVHDELNRVVRQVERVDATKAITTATGYDKVGNRSRFVDGNGNATDYTHTPFGAAESVVEPPTAAHPAPADRTWTTVYDAAGQAVRLVKPGGVTVEREYDAQGRVTVERGAGAEAATADRTFAYDLAGRLVRVGSPSGDSGYRYDERGNLVQSFGAAGNATYTYNGDNTVLTREDASGKATFGYDRAGRQASTVDALSGRTVDHRYDAAGRLALVSDRSVSSWTSRQLAYDALGRPSSDQVLQYVDSGLPPRVLLGAEYDHDLDDKLVAKSVTDTSTEETNEYGYDGAGRLTSWKDHTGTTTQYRWDDAGNRTGVGVETFTYDQRNRLQSGEGATYSYSARGTLASTVAAGQSKASAFDAFDRLVANGAAQYAYDSLDRVVTRGSARFQYAGLSNEAVADGTRLISRLPDGRPLSDKQASATTKGKMLFTDRHGDVIGRYLGASVDGLRGFDPFGEVTRSSGETSSLGYQGDWTDGDTGAVNMTARWYSPGTGSFLSRDDWDIPPSPSSAANRYQYGNNDPVGNADPSGHCPPCLAAAIIAAAGGITAGQAATGAAVLVGGALVIHAAEQAVDNIDSMSRTGTSTTTSPRTGSPGRPMRLDCARGARCYDTVGGPRPPGTSAPTIPRSPAPIVRPPAPPPPPPWVVNALVPLARAAAGELARQDLDPTIELHPTFGATNQIDKAIDENTVITKDGFTHSVDTPDITKSRKDTDEEKGCLDGELKSSVVWYGPLQNNHATGVVACLTKFRGAATREAYPELTGYDSECELAKAHGHLLAHCLGGLDIRENFVPINQNSANVSQMWHGVEKQIKKALEKDETIYYQVIPHFPEDPAMIEHYGVGVPDYIDIYAKGNKGFECAAKVHNVTTKIPSYKGCRQ